MASTRVITVHTSILLGTSAAAVFIRLRLPADDMLSVISEIVLKSSINLISLLASCPIVNNKRSHIGNEFITKIECYMKSYNHTVKLPPLGLSMLADRLLDSYAAPPIYGTTL